MAHQEHHLVGAFGQVKPAEAEQQALFSAPAVLAAISAKAGFAVASLIVETVSTQVVAGLKLRARCALTGAAGEARAANVLAFKPLPHTGLALEVQEVEFVD